MDLVGIFMSQTDSNNTLVSLSDALAEAVAKAGASTVMVDARRRLPASGVVYKPNLVLSADHVVERDEDISVASGIQECLIWLSRTECG